MTKTIETTGFAAFSNDPHAAFLMYGYGATAEEAITDAVKHCEEQRGGHRDIPFTADEFVAIPATAEVADAAGDQVTTIEVDGREIAVVTWEDYDA